MKDSKVNYIQKLISYAFLTLLVISCSKSDLIYDNSQPEQPSFSNQYQLKDLSADVCGGFAADILWVIDNSGSMDKEQQDVIRNTKSFMDEFTVKAQIGWRLGLISTDMSQKPFIGLNGAPISRMEKGHADPVTDFQQAISQLGTGGSYNEVPMDVTLRAFQNDSNFLRNSACLVLIFVTDVKDSSIVSTQTFLNELVRLKGSIEAVRVFTVLTANEDKAQFPNNSDCQTEGSWDYANSSYEELVTATKGERYSLCSPDFGEKLIDIGKKIVELIANSKLLLPNTPKESTIKVSYNGEELPRGAREDGGLWYYSPKINSIIFYDLSFAPGDKERVKVEFEINDGINREK